MGTAAPGSPTTTSTDSSTTAPPRSPPPPPPAKLAPAGSVVLRTSPTAPTQSSATETTIDAAPALELSVALRRSRIVYLTALAVAVLLGLVFTFRHGMALTDFIDSSKTPEQQTKLLDDYNSYTGNIASVFGKPVELFTTAAVQVIILRFMTREATYRRRRSGKCRSRGWASALAPVA